LPLVEDEPETVEKTNATNLADFAQVKALEKTGKYAEALKFAERLGIEHLLKTGNADALFCLSRLGRYQRDARLAREALVKIRDRFVKTKEASNAAFLLGRQAAPAEATRWFSTYLIEQPQGAFAREAAGRLMESFQRSGQFTEAQSAARRYLSEYPSGPHAGFAKSLLANP
jgi:tetratricopeptide (TPR) repeat protein